MTARLINNAKLLIVLGLLFSLPIAAKTWSAHGALPALATSLLVIVAALLGPLSFILARTFESGFVDATALVTDTALTIILVTGAALLIAWRLSLTRAASLLASYLLATGWALIGAYFCVHVVFAHTT